MIIPINDTYCNLQLLQQELNNKSNAIVSPQISQISARIEELRKEAEMMTDLEMKSFQLKDIEELEKSLDVKRVAMVMEGMGVNHAHLKLYPMHGIDEKFKEMWAKEKVYFERYDGYITTQLGPQKTTEELKKVADKILRK